VAAQVQNIPDVLLDCKQKGFGATPVIGIDYRLNEKFNISARYQFQTYMEMKNSADNSPAAQANASLANFQDKKKLRSDIPGYVMAGLQYSPIKQLHLSASYRYFDEKHAKRDMTSNKNEKNPGTHEACFGLEWDIFKYLTFSCGYQGGFYNLTKEEMSELDFQVNSHSVLAGFRINISDHWNIDLGYMHSFYDNRTVTTQPAEGVDYTVKYGRKNDVFGVAVNMCY
jgi:long-subunit fatty acid transport protein